MEIVISIECFNHSTFWCLWWNGVSLPTVCWLQSVQFGTVCTDPMYAVYDVFILLIEAKALFQNCCESYRAAKRLPRHVEQISSSRSPKERPGVELTYSIIQSKKIGAFAQFACFKKLVIHFFSVNLNQESWVVFERWEPEA